MESNVLARQVHAFLILSIVYRQAATAADMEDPGVSCSMHVRVDGQDTCVVPPLLSILLCRQGTESACVICIPSGVALDCDHMPIGNLALGLVRRSVRFACMTNASAGVAGKHVGFDWSTQR